MLHILISDLFYSFLYALQLPPSRPVQKCFIVIVYLAFVLISLALVAYGATIPEDAHKSARSWFFALFFGYHTRYINPVLNVLGLVSLFAQALSMSFSTSTDALSTKGFAVQAVVFTVVGLPWMFRLTISQNFKGGLLIENLVNCYRIVGWPAVDNLAFAFVQAVLFFIAYSRRVTEGGAGETAPLLP